MSFGEDAFPSVLEAAKSGADWAWSALYRDLWGPVAGYLGSRGAADPEDLASEVFLKVARAIHDFDGGEASFRSWVFVIAHRSLIDQRRRSSRRLRETLVPVAADYEGGNVEDDAIDWLVSKELLAAFDNLTLDQRDVLALRMIGGLTLDQTAQVLDKKVGAVKALQRRALAAVQKILEEMGVTL